MRNDRGEITEITMKIAYPDGTKKTVTYDVNWDLRDGVSLIV